MSEINMSHNFQIGQIYQHQWGGTIQITDLTETKIICVPFVFNPDFKFELELEVFKCYWNSESSWLVPYHPKAGYPCEMCHKFCKQLCFNHTYFNDLI